LILLHLLDPKIPLEIMMICCQ